MIVRIFEQSNSSSSSSKINMSHRSITSRERENYTRSKSDSLAIYNSDCDNQLLFLNSSDEDDIDECVTKIKLPIIVCKQKSVFNKMKSFFL